MNDLTKRLSDPLYEFRGWTICNWAGPIFMLFMILGMLFSHNIPPIPGSFTPDQVAATIRSDPNTMRLFLVLGMTFIPCYGIWGIGMGRVMSKIVGKNHVLVDLEVYGAALTIPFLMVTFAFWLTCAYRPNLPPVQLRQLFDNGWMLFDLAYSITSVQMIAVGIACLSDYRAKPLVPRVVSWYGIFVGIAFAAECIMPYFYSGIFSRQGLWNFWIEFMMWFVWCPVLSYYMIKAVPRLKKEKLEESKTAGGDYQRAK